MAEADAKPPKLYGEVSAIDRDLIMVNAMALVAALSTSEPNFIINIGMLMIVSGMHGARVTDPDRVMTEISDCAVHSFASLEAYCADLMKQK
jgi:hypothetical protein